ncbi:beta strand repeat-containing protein, partial [Flavobacterium zhairuonense]|uniref:beta strand repeat-containing protein n=1 Tax=Flavobacterium zhairuonense TaxID=2493631 RepID=UPI001ABFA6E6
MGILLVFVNSVSGQITQPTAWTKASDQASLTSSTNFAIAAGSNRVLVVGISTTFTDASGSDTQNDPTTISYGGVTLTKATGNGGTNGRMHTWLYYLKDNAVMDGTSRTLSVTGGSTGSTLSNMTVWYSVFAGVDQSAAYTVGTGFRNSGSNNAAQLSTGMAVNANEQAIYISSIYNDNSTSAPVYTLNANWTSGGSTTGSNTTNSGTAWKNQVANRTIPASNVTGELATTSTITPNPDNFRFAMSAMSLPRAVALVPTITSFTATSGCVGNSITITGTNFTGATAVTFYNGVAAGTYSVNSSTQITATVPSGAATGVIKVTTSGGTATSAGSFTVNSAPTTSNAGPDQYGFSFTLAANAPTSGTGVWSITSGPSTSLSQFSDVNNRAATFTPTSLAAGSYTLTWTITSSCGSSADDVVVSNCVSNLIKNGDFSNSTGGNNSAANWTYATSKGIYSEVLPENTYFSTSNNDYVSELDAEASLRQTSIPVISGVSYTVTYLYAQRPGAPTPTGLTLKILGGSSTLTDVKSISSTAPQVGTYTFTATSSSIDIEFYNHLLTGNQTVGTMIDNIVLLPTSQLVPVATTIPKGTYKTLDFCTGGNGSVTLDVDNISASGVTYSWTGSSGVVFSSTTVKSPTITFTASGLQSATVTATTAGGCSSNSSTTFINVRAPIITTAATPAVVNAVCSSTSLQYTTLPYSSSINSPTTYSIDWATLTDQNSTSFTSSASGGNVTNIAVPANTAAGTYTGTMTISNGTCTSTKAIILTVNAPSSAPTSITGTTTICSGSTTTLTASGGTLGTGAAYQWGTGSVVGTNPISGATSSTYTTPTLTGNATYWVRIENTTSPCTATTGGISQVVTVNAPSSAPTSISGITTICSGSTTTLTASGGTLGTGARYQWG